MTPSSSIYFLTNDETMGPTTPIWWGEDRPTKMLIPLYAFSECKNPVAIETRVVAQVNAQNQCGKTALYEMNAGRGDSDCSEQRFKLALDTNSKSNQWRNNATLANCQFETPKVRPVAIDAYRWHEPNSGQRIASMKIAIIVSF
jgi:hypothetical protein